MTPRYIVIADSPGWCLLDTVAKSEVGFSHAKTLAEAAARARSYNAAWRHWQMIRDNAR